MTRAFLAILVGIGAVLANPLSAAELNAFPMLTEPYLGQPAPGDRPVLFASGIVSTDTREWSMALTPDGREIFFGLATREMQAILHTAIEDGRWTPIAIAEFSGEFDDLDLTMAPSGNRLYFSSARPAVAGGKKPEHTDIWYVDRSDEGWGDPVRLPEPINSPARELYPSESNAGQLIFFSNRPGGHGGSDLYSAEIMPDGFGPPTNLGPNVNTEAGETDACISPDGSYLIFTSGRDGGFGRGDLYITFKLADGSWAQAQNLGPRVNTEYTEFCPSISADGKLLFFTSNRSRPRPIPTRDGGLRSRLGVTNNDNPPDIDIYWMDASFIESLRPAERE